MKIWQTKLSEDPRLIPLVTRVLYAAGMDFSDHLRCLRDRLLDRLRWARWDRFAALDAQPDWPQLRRVESLGPDPHWGTTIDKLSSDLMDARIEEGLVQLLGAVPPTSGRPLLRLNDCSCGRACRSMSPGPTKGWPDAKCSQRSTLPAHLTFKS